MTQPDTTGAKQDGKFQRGVSGNPRGRPPGRNHAIEALDAIGQEAAADVLTAVIDSARKGDTTAAALLLSRCWPAPKSRAVTVPLPTVTDAASMVAALAAVVAAVAAAQITPDEAQTIVALLENVLRAAEAAEEKAQDAWLKSLIKSK